MDVSVIGIIGTILGSVDLIAVVSLLLFYKPNKKAKDIENDTNGNAALQSVITTLREQLERSDADSKEKQQIIDHLRDENEELRHSLIKAEQANQINCFWKCDVKGCALRQPPNGL
jgi:hypothetical protein